MNFDLNFVAVRTNTTSIMRKTCDLAETGRNVRDCLDVRHDFVSSDGPNIGGGLV